MEHIVHHECILTITRKKKCENVLIVVQLHSIATSSSPARKQKVLGGVKPGDNKKQCKFGKVETSFLNELVFFG